MSHKAPNPIPEHLKHAKPVIPAPPPPIYNVSRGMNANIELGLHIMDMQKAQIESLQAKIAIMQELIDATQAMADDGSPECYVRYEAAEKAYNAMKGGA